MGISVKAVTSSDQQQGEALSVLIWVADDQDRELYLDRCVDFCARKGYEIVAVVDQGAGGVWADAQGMVDDGRVGVIVVSGRDQLPADRLPRIEAVADERRAMTRPGASNSVRPQFLRRR